MSANPNRIQKQIDERNKLWKKATKRQKAVLVAKDVIERIDAKQLRANTGVWLEFSNTSSYSQNSPLQECILGGESCTGCAMGGLMMSTIAYRNEVTSDSLYGHQLDEESSNFNLSEVFTDNQLELIEQAFEGGHGKYDFEFDSFNRHNLSDGDVPYPDEYLAKYWITKYRKACKSAHDKRIMRILSFYKRYQDEDNRRLKLIMQNIIKNKGLFVI